MYDQSKFEELVKEGYLRKSEKDGLVLYGYTDKCTYDRHWDEYTRVARGLILDRSGNVVAKPFPKFFNLGEMPETSLSNLPKMPYMVHEKLDGSLGIIFFHNGSWQVATRGSFYSEQAAKAQEMLTKYDLTNAPENVTLLVEIIYPENKIIVNYGTEEKLVLLAVYCNITLQEFPPDFLPALGNMLGMPVANTYDLTIEEMIELQTIMPKDEEGFVVRFHNGLRVKIKGVEYMRIAKLMAHMSPIALWESMEDGHVKTDILMQLPEEMRIEFEPTVEILEKQYKEVLDGIKDLAAKLPEHDISTREGKKTVGLFLKNNPAEHSGAIFPYLYEDKAGMDKYIMKVIRPDGNVLVKNEA